MPDSHSIRLAGPWEYEVLACFSSAPVGTAPMPKPSGRIKMSADWGETLGDDFRGRLRFDRKFNCPTGLDDDLSVWLIVEQADAVGTVSVNGEPLGSVASSRQEFEIGRLLKLHNSVSIEVELAAEDETIAPPRHADRLGLAGGVIGEVRLEIRST